MPLGLHRPQPWSIHGLIRLDYTPAWLVMGLAAERLHDFLVELTPAVQAPLEGDCQRILGTD